MTWLITSAIILVVLAIAYFFLYRSMNQKKSDFDKMYKTHKQVKEIFVLNKKIVKQPIREGLKFPKVKTYQVVARITISQAMKGQSFTSTQTHTFMMEKKEFEKIQVNQKYRVELAGNYIGKIVSGKKVG
ncbi:MAG TPA: hypothetical protein VJ824_10575 [Bacillota bacterium]|nr:hypothetical protein [Bacillota bacterium]